ncbi:hypothetical protein RQP50_20920 [Paenibacillus sp. chi10]|uniref:Uncharacterized protein n=1 Tax=Paenibacillus suaedae TaxID=3077233 RepID=A0AAJ2JYA0_9BACL|nr:hypothetical protein [Paenibacillus sp. chi10]
MKNYLRKNEIIELLDRGTEIDQKVFEEVDGEAFAASKETVLINGLVNPVKLLIPKTTWTKQDYIIQLGDLELIGTEKDTDKDTQLLLGVKGIEETFITTYEAISQLFSECSMGKYASFLLKEPDEHFSLLEHNFNYWFKGKLAEKKVLLRTVVENGQRIARCFASPEMYQQIDNHILLYCTIWALDKLGFRFNLTSQDIRHSRMTLKFTSEEVFKIPGIGIVSYGFTVRNSEAKTHSVELLPTCHVQNEDGTSVPIVLDKIIRIRHFGKEINSVISKMMELEKLPEHVENAVEVIKLMKTQKVNDLLIYRVRRELIDIIGDRAFKKYKEKYAEVLSSNTYNLLQFFGRLNEVPVDDEQKKLAIESMFWSFMQRND